LEPATQKTLALAEEVTAVLRRRGIEPLLIGALALAVHRHPRNTVDVDVAIAVPPQELQGLAAEFRALGREVQLSLPDASDPLGGVLTICSPESAPVQIVNFDNSPAGGFPALVKDASAEAIEVKGLPLRVVGLNDLILFKLYAGGPKSENDILELLCRNRVDLEELRRRCANYRLTHALNRLLERSQG
jgi:predicted nucleotidyltransferase